jgi:hypothetical protein
VAKSGARLKAAPGGSRLGAVVFWGQPRAEELEVGVWGFGFWVWGFMRRGRSARRGGGRAEASSVLRVAGGLGPARGRPVDGATARGGAAPSSAPCRQLDLALSFLAESAGVSLALCAAARPAAPPPSKAVKAVVPKVLAWSELLAAGEAAPAPPQPPKPEDLCTIMYTSGTTGEGWDGGEGRG